MLKNKIIVVLKNLTEKLLLQKHLREWLIWNINQILTF